MKRTFTFIIIGLFFTYYGFSQNNQSEKLVYPENLTYPVTGKVVNYYIAVDEVEWDYAPGDVDPMTGKPWEGAAKVFIEKTPTKIGKKYRKAIYQEYTDDSFTNLKPKSEAWEHTGILGPIIRAEVGDLIQIVFRNNGFRPYSMHPHGVFYTKQHEGALYHDGVPMESKKGSAVPSGGTHTYIWEVPERAGPAPNDPNSLVWLYHSHVHEPKDVNAGLIGAIIINAKGASKPDGTPIGVDREFVTLFTVLDENQSWYFDYNVETYVEDPDSMRKLFPVTFFDPSGKFHVFGADGWGVANLKFTINGFLAGTMPMMSMKKGETVRWYLMSIGNGINFHTPHWHGNVVMQDKKRTDVISLMPAQMVTVDMIPDDVGMWMYHCHVDDHMEAGMHTHYMVTED
jgi:FtsP/CotA-like multicopper oxidase with cupredoxin domain